MPDLKRGNTLMICEIETARELLGATENETLMDAALRWRREYIQLAEQNSRLWTMLDESKVRLAAALDRERAWERVAIHIMKAERVTFICPLCGQHITDGKPCGCGAR